MSDFRAHIVGDLDLSEARSQMESFLNEYKDKKLKITPEINTSQAQKAGEQAAQAVSKGMEKAHKVQVLNLHRLFLKVLQRAKKEKIYLDSQKNNKKYVKK